MEPFFGMKHLISRNPLPEEDLLRLIDGLSCSTALVAVDENVARAFPGLERLAGPRTRYQVVPCGEERKNLDGVVSFVHRNEAHLDQRSIVVAVGGGALIDLIGFSTGILYRGLRYVSVPTSIIGMADSAYGGKTAVNLSAKNQLGLYHDPELVYVNPAFLKTLPRDHCLSGLVEICKVAFFDRDLADRLDALDLSESFDESRCLHDVVVRAAARKLRLFLTDPREEREASLFLYGHPFANAFEACTWGRSGEYVPHGYAVALGMLFSAWVAGRRAPSFAELMNGHRRALSKFLDLRRLAARYTPARPEEFRAALMKDRYCCMNQVRLPALYLDETYTTVPLEELVNQYPAWREAMFP